MKRTRVEIVRDILHVAEGGAKKTHIQYKCNLSFGMLEKYLTLLLKMELLEAGTLYHATEKGLRFLEAYETLEGLLGVETW